HPGVRENRQVDPTGGRRRPRLRYRSPARATGRRAAVNGRAFGTAIITPTVPTDSAPARGGQRFDCGRHGRLTVVQIARIAGTSRTAIYQRIRAGRTGEALCEPRW